MDATIQPLIKSLQQAIPLLVRSAPSSGDYLEGVLSVDHLQTCTTMLSSALGPPGKDFNQPAKFEPKLQKVIGQVGGIRPDQCLFLNPQGAGHVIYAALWPWASDHTRITLRVGIIVL